jgi:hypothetical protein
MGKTISIDEAVEIADRKKGLEGLNSISNNQIEEKRTSSVQSLLKPSEKECFISLIGRETESNAVRNLILKFIDSKKME